VGVPSRVTRAGEYWLLVTGKEEEMVYHQEEWERVMYLPLAIEEEMVYHQGDWDEEEMDFHQGDWDEGNVPTMFFF
jgi:hypothetical protein